MSNLITIQHLCICLFSSFSASPKKNSHYSPVQFLCGNPWLVWIMPFSISSGYFITNTPSDTFIMIFLTLRCAILKILSDNNVVLILFFKSPAFSLTSNRDFSWRARTGKRIMPFFLRKEGGGNHASSTFFPPATPVLVFNEQLQMTALITASGHWKRPLMIGKNRGPFASISSSLNHFLW